MCKKLPYYNKYNAIISINYNKYYMWLRNKDRFRDDKYLLGQMGGWKHRYKNCV